MPSRAYDIHAMSAADLPLLRRWRAPPHVAARRGAPEVELAPLSGDPAAPAIEALLVATEGRPFGYLECYDQAASPASAVAGQPAGGRGTDPLIGEPHLSERGHGSPFMRAFLERLFAARWPRVLTGPDRKNVRAIRAYETAGFRAYREVEMATDPALLLLRDNNRTIPA